eukprot:CAMPEP_0175078660 /NCGR_PEP_ID=MMETSP0052_2-20121109/24281_1 /TAXON_ID=51329 ORGANISM="Polytomella parva, Strain SAG 63-3" /NCGR_SAMPLE_ID=MMETSP0052_2 /ASSEMBLY_ACC=CAM_ASM_000194 /LENGTH=83 /DNA_ID=CAMNT_0016348685 /DNA_START=104 /DNA_END=356 /DNA_ORIENTATION=+
MSMTFKGNCIQGFKESYNNLISNPFQMTHPQQHRQSSLLSQLLSYAASSKSGDNEDLSLACLKKLIRASANVILSLLFLKSVC